MHDHISLIEERQSSYQAAVGKLEKYLYKLLQNDWVCAAFALDPINRGAGLRTLFDTYSTLFEDGNLQYRYDHVVSWIQSRAETHKKAAPVPTSGSKEAVTSTNPRRKNAFASRNSAQQTPLSGNEMDLWNVYNDDSGTFEAEGQESVLEYWRRQCKNTLLEPLAQVARDLMGLAASTTSVERLFSQSGFVFGRGRGSLSTRLLVKKTSLKIWRAQGFTGEAKTVAL